MNAGAHHIQEMLAPRRGTQFERGRDDGNRNSGLVTHCKPHCMARMRADRRLLCRAALLRWMICLLTRASMTGTAFT